MRRTIIPTLALLFAFAVPAPALAKTLVRYEKAGGIAGIQQSLTISDAGRVRATASRGADVATFKLPSADLRALRRMLRAARFSTLRTLYAGTGEVADGFTETVGYAGRTVTVRTGGHPPSRLRALLSRLGELVRR